MKCADLTDLIAWYPTGQLTDNQRAAVVRHTAACPACRAELARTLALARAVQDAAVRLPGAPRDLRATVLAAAGAAPPRPDAVDQSLAILRLVLPDLTEVLTNPLVLLPEAAGRWLPIPG